jgi:flavin-dependent dehydrogenase
MKHVIDRFGEKARMEIFDGEHFAAYINVSDSPTFFAWVFTFGGGITAPKDVLASCRGMAKAAVP